MPKQVALDIKAAYEIYLSYTEIGTREITRIFNCGSSCAYNLKKKALSVMKERGKETLFPHNVNTKCAYEAWHIDVSELERRVSKLKKYEGVTT